MATKTIEIEIKEKTFAELERFAAAEDMTIGELGQRVVTRYVRRMLQKADGTHKPTNMLELRGLIELVFKQGQTSAKDGKADDTVLKEWNDALRADPDVAIAS